MGEVILTPHMALLIGSTLVGIVVWSLKMFAWSDPTNSKFKEQHEFLVRMEKEMNQVREDVAYIRGQMERKA